MESDLSVRDVLTTAYVGVSESDTVLDAVRLMRTERAGCVLVLRGSEPVGIMTEWDVLGVVDEERSPRETTVETAMSSPVLTIEATRSVTDAADRMTRENIRNLVVEHEGEILGVLTQRDIIAVAGSFQGTTARREPTEPVAGNPVSNETDDLLANGGDEYTRQGVCEACGSLAGELWEANGQLLCADCRSV